MSSFQDKAQGHIANLDKEVSIPHHACSGISRASACSTIATRSFANVEFSAAFQVSPPEQLGEADLRPKDLCCPRTGLVLFLLHLLQHVSPCSRVLLAQLLMGCSGGQLLVNLAGFVIPGYYSLEALFSVSKTDDTQWLTVCFSENSHREGIAADEW